MKALEQILASCAACSRLLGKNKLFPLLFPLLVLEVCLAFCVWQGLKALSK